jgi:hypothetical protein
MQKTRDLGCGILTVLLITLPVWVLTTAWRGPLYAARGLLLIAAAVVILAFISRSLDRRAKRP